MTDTQTLLAFINQAKTNGFDNDTYLTIITYLIEERTLPLRAILGILMMNHEFTRAAWGEDPTYNGQNILALSVVLKQNVVEYMGKRYRVRPSDRLVRLWEFRQEDTDAVVSDEAYSKIAFQLEEFAQTMALEPSLFEIDGLDITGTIPSYRYHSQQAVTSPDPFEYVRGTLV